MYIINKGIAVKAFFSNYRPLILVLLLSIFTIGLASNTLAQDKSARHKPKLIPIILDEKTNDPRAENIIRKIYSNWAKENRKDKKIGNINANFFALQKIDSKHIFVIGQLLDEPYGGCFARGCRTIIFYSKDGGKEWTGVFNAFIISAWYDDNTRGDHPANLVFSSSLGNKKPGVWVWNGRGYFLANKDK